MDLHGEVLHPLLEGRHRTDLPLDIDQVAVELALFGYCDQKQGKLLSRQDVLRVIFALCDEGAKAMGPVALAEHPPVLGRDCDVMMRKVVKDFSLFEMKGTISCLLFLSVYRSIMIEEDIFFIAPFHIMAQIKLIIGLLSWTGVRRELLNQGLYLL